MMTQSPFAMENRYTARRRRWYSQRGIIASVEVTDAAFDDLVVAEMLTNTRGITYPGIENGKNVRGWKDTNGRIDR
jgi:hypothetical protein